MKEDTFPMTAEGLDSLKQELREYETVKRKRAKERITRARKFCDFNEDSEYEMALKELATIHERISTIQYMIQQAHIIQNTDKSNVEIGHTVSFQDISSNEIETYTIVGTEEADPSEGRLSHKSPIAHSIIGTKINDTVTVKTPAGNRQVKIVAIK